MRLVHLVLAPLFLTAIPAQAGPVSLNCPAGSTLVEIKPGDFACKSVVDDPKPVKRPECRSGERLSTRDGADQCVTPAVEAEIRQPKCKSGWSYKAHSGQDKCTKYSVAAGNLSENPSCVFMKPGNIPDVWPYQVRSSVDACLKPGTGTAEKTRSLPSNTCSRSVPMGGTLTTDLRDNQDWCTLKGTKVVYTTPTPSGGRRTAGQAVRRR